MCSNDVGFKTDEKHRKTRKEVRYPKQTNIEIGRRSEHVYIYLYSGYFLQALSVGQEALACKKTQTCESGLKNVLLSAIITMMPK